MKQRIICKTLAVAVIILFVGVGIQPAIADISSPAPEEIYENSNCFVIGISTEATRVPALLWGILFGKGNFSKFICFGTYDRRDGGDTPSEGWIYTKGDMGEWLFEGEFYGKLEVIAWTDLMAKYIGIKDFCGLAIGGPFLYLFTANTFFIGFAKEVKITTQSPV